MRILLILPAGESVRVTRERPRVPQRSMLRFSVLGLTVVAALTPKEHEVRIVDENVEPLDLGADVDLVGITFMTALAPRAYEIAAAFRARGIPVVGGGYHATLMPEEAGQHCDAIVTGDAEGIWPQVVRDVERGELRRFYRALPTAEFHSPAPRRDLLRANRRRYATLNAVQTGRGCNHACRYCSVTTFHQRRYRHRPVEEVIEELRGIPRDLILVDDNIIADREYARALFQAMIPLRKRWVTQCPIEVADDDALLALMRRAGCRGLFLGIETSNPQNLAEMNKEFNDSRGYERRLRLIHRAGIGVVAGMMVGLDRDDPGVFERCLGFLDRNGIEGLQLNILTPLPGTPLFRSMCAEGRMRNLDWSHYDFRHVVFQPEGMTAEELQQGADWLYAQFYRLDRMIIRFARTWWTSGWVPAWLGWKLSRTYRYDNRREGIRGSNPARRDEGSGVWPWRAMRLPWLQPAPVSRRATGRALPRERAGSSWNTRTPGDF